MKITGKETFEKMSTTSDNMTGPAFSSGYDLPVWLFTLLNQYISYAMVLVSVFGMIGNILIISAYAKIGFSESINISYCALGISDALSVPFMTWHAICFFPVFAKWNITRLIEVPTGGAPAEVFFMVTAWITACISLERCLCVLFPFKVKTFVTRRRTIMTIITIFTVITLPLFSMYSFLYQLEMKFDFAKNRTFLLVRYRNTPLANKIYDFSYMCKGIFLNLLPLFIVLICTVFLAIQLKINAKWRRGNSSSTAQEDPTDKRKTGKDMRVAKTVLLIAVAFIFLAILSAVRQFIAFLWPAFRPVGAYRNMYITISRLSFLLLEVNSSVNFIIYYKMGTKFRNTVRQMLCQAKEQQS